MSSRAWNEQVKFWELKKLNIWFPERVPMLTFVWTGTKVGKFLPYEYKYLRIFPSEEDLLFAILIMFKVKVLATFGLLASTAAAGLTIANEDQDMSGLVVNSIPYSTRIKYMRLVCPSAQNLIFYHRWPYADKPSLIRPERSLPICFIQCHNC